MIKKTVCSLCSAKDNFKLRYRFSKFNIVECNNCKLLTRDKVFTKKEIENLYSQDYFCELQKDYFSAGISQDLNSSLRVMDFKDRLKKISRYTKLSKGRILDVGCATGVFLKVAKDKDWQTTGVEVSKYAVLFGRKKFNLNIFLGELKDAKLNSNYFDVVTGWDLIEHVENPTELLKEIRRVLNPKGFVCLQTTMTDSLLFLIADITYRITLGKFAKLAQIAYPIHHSNHFSRQTLKELLKKNGFKVICQENVEMFYEETSLPKVFIPFLKSFGLFSKFSGRTIEVFMIGQKNS